MADIFVSMVPAWGMTIAKLRVDVKNAGELTRTIELPFAEVPFLINHIQAVYAAEKEHIEKLEKQRKAVEAMRSAARQNQRINLIKEVRSYAGNNMDLVVAKNIVEAILNGYDDRND